MGLAGRSAGSGGENWLWPEGDESARRPLLDKVTVRLSAGDAVQIFDAWRWRLGLADVPLNAGRSPGEGLSH